MFVTSWMNISWVLCARIKNKFEVTQQAHSYRAYSSGRHTLYLQGDKQVLWIGSEHLCETVDYPWVQAWGRINSRGEQPEQRGQDELSEREETEPRAKAQDLSPGLPWDLNKWGRTAIYNVKCSRKVKDKDDTHFDDKTDSLKAVWLDCNYWETGAISAAPVAQQVFFPIVFSSTDWQ